MQEEVLGRGGRAHAACLGYMTAVFSSPPQRHRVLKKLLASTQNLFLLSPKVNIYLYIYNIYINSQILL